MKASTRNTAAGDINIAKGKTKAVTGKLVRSPVLEAKGRAQTAVGRIQKSVGTRQKAEGY